MKLIKITVGKLYCDLLIVSADVICACESIFIFNFFVRPLYSGRSFHIILLVLISLRKDELMMSSVTFVFLPEGGIALRCARGIIFVW